MSFKANWLVLAITSCALLMSAGLTGHAQQAPRVYLLVDTNPNNVCIQSGGTGQWYVKNVTSAPVHVVLQRLWTLNLTSGQDKPEYNVAPNQVIYLGCLRDGSGNTNAYNLLRVN